MSRRKSKFPQEIFLSHCSKDLDFANSLVTLLRRHGLPVWFSPTEIIGAQQWHDEIGSALNRCDWFVVILSPHAVRSPWVKRELLYALNDVRYAERIAPVLYKTCDTDKLSWTLRSSCQCIDFRRGFTRGSKELLKIWGKGYQRA